MSLWKNIMKVFLTAGIIGKALWGTLSWRVHYITQTHPGAAASARISGWMNKLVEQQLQLRMIISSSLYLLWKWRGRLFSLHGSEIRGSPTFRHVIHMSLDILYINANVAPHTCSNASSGVDSRKAVWTSSRCVNLRNKVWQWLSWEESLHLCDALMYLQRGDVSVEEWWVTPCAVTQPGLVPVLWPTMVLLP